MSSETPLVGVIMGSQSDWETMRHATDVLTGLDIPHEVRIVSAHRTPDRLAEYAKTSASRGLKCIIAGAGGAAHLPGMAAAWTALPVFGVPVESKALSGMDSLLSIAQMPGGVPVGTLAIGKAGAKNAGLIAASVIALLDEGVSNCLRDWRAAQTDGVALSPKEESRDTCMEYLPVGSTIGILGGGQLGRMLVLAAAPLGYKCHIYCPESDAPATQVAYRISHAPYEDHRQLLRFSDNVDVVTYEFENIPVATARFLEQRRRILPGPLALEVAQDRFMEKSYLTRLEIPTVAHQAFYTLDQLEVAAKVIGLPAVAKTRRLGYDGKGQVKIDTTEQLEDAWESFGDARAILEGFVDFKKEVSVLVARALDGEMAFYPVAENVHRNHILAETVAPANISDSLAERAQQMAGTIAEALDYIGVMAVEMFVTQDDELLVNEIAPRVHNSGHWTIEGAKTSQFEQHVRCICGLPLGSTELVGPSRMENLIGDEIERRLDLLQDSRAHLHLYGKLEVREGRKMGHVTWVEESEDG